MIKHPHFPVIIAAFKIFEDVSKKRKFSQIKKQINFYISLINANQWLKNMCR